MLYEFIADNRSEIIRRCRDKVATRSVSPPIDAEIDHGVPLFLDQLVDALRHRLKSNTTIGRSAVQHGQALRLQGFTVSQVVHEYGDVCQAITELAVELGTPISTDDFGTLNRCLDDAIASAVTEYGRGQNQSTLDRESVRGNERLGFLAHELRNLINTAVFAFKVLQTRNVGIAGSTGGVLNRSLMGLRALIDRSLGEVRLTEVAQHREQFQVSGFIEEVALAAALEANARGITLAVLPIEDGVTIEADRQVLAAAVGNLLQNAFKFTRPRTTVTLRVCADAERVRIEIEDECSGIPGENLDELFRPFEQRSTDRTGLGLGLALLDGGHFFGEGCLAGQPQRMATATAMAPCTIMAVDKQDMSRYLHARPAFADRFLTHMLTRNIRIEEDLIDQLFNSSEKRLARTLLLLARYGEPEASHRTLPRVSQEVLAEMVGTTRSRVNFFMNKFRKLGFINYNGGLKVNNSLLTVVLRD